MALGSMTPDAQASLSHAENKSNGRPLFIKSSSSDNPCWEYSFRRSWMDRSA